VAYPGKDDDGFDDTYPSVWLTDEDATKDITITGKPYVLNVQQTGYYRVNYNPDTWMNLASNLKTDPEMFHRINRAQLVDDAFNLARAEQLSYYVPVEMAKYLMGERDYIPIKAALNNLEYLELMFRP
jgi:aminopeptidase N